MKLRFNKKPFSIEVISNVLMTILTFGKYIRGITLYPFIIYRNESISLNPRIRNHESIHIKQQFELSLVAVFAYIVLGLLIGEWLWTIPVLFLFYILYILSSIFMGYVYNPFEREAYTMDNDLTYLERRKLFSWMKYIIL